MRLFGAVGDVGDEYWIIVVRCDIERGWSWMRRVFLCEGSGCLSLLFKCGDHRLQ